MGILPIDRQFLTVDPGRTQEPRDRCGGHHGVDQPPSGEPVLRGPLDAGGAALELDGQVLERRGAEAFPRLSDRELEILDHVAGGLSNAAIASRLYLSDKTVRNVVSNIFAKVGARDRAEVIVLARQAGLGGG